MVARSCLYIHAVSGLTSGRWAEDGGKQAIASLSAAVKLFAEQGSETTDETANAYFASAPRRCVPPPDWMTCKSDSDPTAREMYRNP